jgi:hypothetical protein
MNQTMKFCLIPDNKMKGWLGTQVEIHGKQPCVEAARQLGLLKIPKLKFRELGVFFFLTFFNAVKDGEWFFNRDSKVFPNIQTWATAKNLPRIFSERKCVDICICKYFLASLIPYWTPYICSSRGRFETLYEI